MKVMKDFVCIKRKVDTLMTDDSSKSFTYRQMGGGFDVIFVP